MRPGPFFFRAQATPPFGDSSGKEKVAPVARPTSGPSQGREAPLHTSFEQGGGAYIGCRAAKPPGSVGPLARPLPPANLLPPPTLAPPSWPRHPPPHQSPCQNLIKTLNGLLRAGPAILWWPSLVAESSGPKFGPKIGPSTFAPSNLRSSHPWEGYAVMLGRLVYQLN